jgi:hypothetical protein
MIESEYKDWEKQVSEFLKMVIDHPESETRVCDMLCEFIMDLVEDERAIGRQKMLKVLKKLETCWRPGDKPEPYR